MNKHEAVMEVKLKFSLENLLSSQFSPKNPSSTNIGWDVVLARPPVPPDSQVSC